MKHIVENNLQYQQRTDATIQNIETHLGQFASSMSQMQSHGFAQTPSQLIPDPKGNVSVAMLQSGRTLPKSAQRIDESIVKIEHFDEVAEVKKKKKESSAIFVQEKSNQHSIFHLDIIDYVAKGAL